ncbi:MAG: type ISP restriction/modification enzyme, partial [Rhodanobacteraceae bacterium]
HARPVTLRDAGPSSGAARKSSGGVPPLPPEGEGKAGRIWINDAQYFGGVPEAVWDVHIGGYRVAEKWLKDRKGRQLAYDDVTHYQNVIAALSRTLELQARLDAIITSTGSWPLR